jgi:ribulose-5-phosphate 4-epimerase/fuculose-1-phosphate aldolase
LFKLRCRAVDIIVHTHSYHFIVCACHDITSFRKKITTCCFPLQRSHHHHMMNH